MKFSKVTAIILALLMASAQFAVGAGSQDLTSDETQKIETATAGNSPKEDIVKNPLRPPDTSSPRATLQSFLHNINRAYAMLMAAHRKNMQDPGMFTSESVAQMERQVEILLQRSAYCLNLSAVPDDLKQLLDGRLRDLLVLVLLGCVPLPNEVLELHALLPGDRL